MRELTKSKSTRIAAYSALTKSMIRPKTLIIFNSVFHEINGYWLTLKEVIKDTRKGERSLNLTKIIFHLITLTCLLWTLYYRNNVIH